MTVDAFTPAGPQLIDGTGPYDVPHPYDAGSLRLSVLSGTGITELDPADWSVAPGVSQDAGTVTLSAPAAALHAGATLLIDRETPEEQGWAGVGGGRERGLEAQLDRVTMRVQELSIGVSRSLRLTTAVAPVAPVALVPGRAVLWTGTGFAAGPDAADIANAQANAAAAAASALEAALYDDPRLDSVAALLADTALTYTIPSPGAVAPGRIVLTRRERFSYEVAPAGATDHHIATAGGVKLYAIPVTSVAGQSFTARQFGAVDSTTSPADITAPLQAAINAALYPRSGEAMQDVLVDVSKAVISDTIHCSYGVETKTVDLVGLGGMYSDNSAAHAGTVLYYTATSGPALVFQGGRKPRLRGLAIWGVAATAIQNLRSDPGAEESENGSRTFLRPANFDVREWDKALWSAGVVPNRRYNPYAAVALDPRSGARPADRTITAVTTASPAVITTGTAHDLLDLGRAEAVLISGLGAVGIADGEYYALRTSNTQAQLFNLDWTPTTGTGTATGTFGRSYPDAPPYPPATGAPDPGTGKLRSSGFVVEDCHFRGFEFGTVLNPGTQGSNGDFAEFRHLDVFYSKFAHAVSHANARTNNFERCNIFGCFCYITGARTGVAIGNVNARIAGAGGGYFVKWFETSGASRIGSCTFDHCHAEGIGMLGTVLSGTGSAGNTITFLGGVQKFQDEWGRPPACLESIGGVAALSLAFIGGELRSHGPLTFMSRSVSFDGTTRSMRTDPYPVRPYRSMAVNNSSVITAAPNADLGRYMQTRANIDTGALDAPTTVTLGPGMTQTGRTSCIPTHARQVTTGPANESAAHALNVPQFAYTLGNGSRSFGGSPISLPVQPADPAPRIRVGSITFTITASLNEARMKQNGILPGNKFVDNAGGGNGTQMTIRSVDYTSREIIATLDTNWHDNGVDAAGLFDPTWDWTLRSWALYRNDLFTPPRRLIGTFTSGSAVITDIRTVGRAATTETAYGLATGDWLAAR
ncbi:MAG TPA: hypothetical protein PKD10_15975, partial [Paracoccaceae bacterium]|nr:hypothetical protein [Paracoccaceae bacterium]